MYLEYFGFSKAPFQITPDNDFLYVSQQHARAMVYMEYATWKPGGFVVITGEIGSGKTTLVKWLVNEIKNKASCLHVEFTNLTGNDLFLYLLRQVNIVPKKEDKISLIYYFRAYLIKNYQSGKPCVLIIDEAQNLSKNQLEDIRMLAALEGPEGTDGPLMRITLLAQPEFIESMNSSEQFKQRVKLHYHLKGLDLEDVTKYIEYRLEKAGLKENDLFDETIINKIFKYSHGLPRLINKICDALLMCAYAEEKTVLRAEDLESILPDLMIDVPSKITKAPILDLTVKNINQMVSIDGSNPLLERLVLAVERLNDNVALIASDIN